MFLHALGVATFGTPAIALGILASAFGAGGSDQPEYRPTTPPARETARPHTTSPAPVITPRTTKTPAPATAATSVTFEALLSECVARYKRAAPNTKEACDRAIAASGLTTNAFLAKYRSLLVPPAKTETPKPTPAPKLDTSDPKVRECLAKYETLKSLKASGSQTFDAALRYFAQTCNTALGRGAT
jgi:hypothetical protein